MIEDNNARLGVITEVIDGDTFEAYVFWRHQCLTNLFISKGTLRSLRGLDS